jgi:D-3-phosphoglycerate dehydrogenase / 2-oxoglutarate reductase
MKILVVGDSFVPVAVFRQGLAPLEKTHRVTYLQLDESHSARTSTESSRRIREYLGTPEEIAARLDDNEILVVHGAPVTDEVLAAGYDLKLVCCARGGPVNVDVMAATVRRIPVVNTPGKNAEAVADLTLAFMVMLARGLPKAERFMAQGHRLRDNWEGARFIGSDLRRHVLGLIGFGQIGRRVAERAAAFGTTVIVYDPYVKLESSIEQVGTLRELLERADFVSLHARASADNVNMIDEAALRAMKPGAFFLNTARETLVDEAALDAALASGHLGGAALDVVDSGGQPDGRPHPLLRHENVILTPHLAGATHETLLQGAAMIAAEITRFAAGEPLVNVVNARSAAA